MQKVNYFTLTDEGFLSCFKRFFYFPTFLRNLFCLRFLHVRLKQKPYG